MSIYICLITQLPIIDISNSFDENISFEEVTLLPIGRATLGQRPKGNAYLVTFRGCSTDLNGMGSSRKNCPHLFINGIQKILEKSVSVSFLTHWFTTFITEEEVHCKDTLHIQLSEFVNLFPKLIANDIRYTVIGLSVEITDSPILVYRRSGRLFKSQK